MNIIKLSKETKHTKKKLNDLAAAGRNLLREIMAELTDKIETDFFRRSGKK